MPPAPAYLRKIPVALERLGRKDAPAMWVAGGRASEGVGDVARLLGCHARTASRILRKAKGARMLAGAWVIGSAALATSLTEIHERHGGDERLRPMRELLGEEEERVARPATPAARREVLAGVTVVAAGQVAEVEGPALVIRAATLKAFLAAAASVHDEHAGGARQREFEARLQGRVS